MKTHTLLFFLTTIFLIFSYCATNTENNNTETDPNQSEIDLNNAAKEYVVPEKYLTINPDYTDELQYIQKKFIESYNTWLEEKEKHNNTYYFIHGFESVFEFGDETYVAIKEGIIVEHSHRAFRLSGYVEKDGKSTSTFQYSDEFTRTGKDINVDEAPTLDQMYVQCANILFETDPNSLGYEIGFYFNTLNNGFIGSCGYSILSCEDDCDTSIDIREFGFDIKPFSHLY